ncbi:ribonuclease Z [Prochlorothrix hollandica]|uniref:Ribonuclease Z n=1 Tax=Prochlorothrix hollandica PCC 9006 = CALU 1027 TaxID=317619 RepID=A0A0M2PY61_PROHO|nr:ribonuclease Z [Prochlorothrix hollandica]KKI99306.1 ribonuclease Z [Prochlorothrix hollandica PCC 9006 = CALU 1027]
MQIIFLGTSSGVPTRSRNVSAIALRLTQRGEVWLFDCGEGTQHQLLRSDLRISQLRRIFVTHMHGDHTFGLMGLLASCGLAGNPTAIDIYGPKPLRDYLQACGQYSQTHLSYPLNTHSVKPGLVWEDEDYQIHCRILEHRVTAFGYRVQEKDRPGRLDVAQVKALGIPPGPLYGELKAGKTVTLADGRTIRGRDLCGPSRVGRSFVYCTDTVFCESAIALAQGASVLVHEATFAHQDADMAFQRLHSTSTMAAQVALAAGVDQLILTHFSPRYAPGNAVTLDNLLGEARSIFPNTILAQDFMSYDIPEAIAASA